MKKVARKFIYAFGFGILGWFVGLLVAALFRVSPEAEPFISCAFTFMGAYTGAKIAD
jgi:hypothetical protein